MGLRFRKSFKIAPGIKINLNKKSMSVTMGGKGFHHTINSSGKTTTSVGIPGTGISYTKTSGKTKAKNRTEKNVYYSEKPQQRENSIRNERYRYKKNATNE